MPFLEIIFWYMVLLWFGFAIFGKNPEKACSNALYTLAIIFLALYFLSKAYTS